ncbi:hypothetical protein C0993_005332 [Termitomyces sp. T159_Od127]|nr:hypothetical protein C0993_005332 [Termitomyces sp. T159_Od127]
MAESEPEHETEWAADKIISHSGSGNDAIFQVLWRAGDKNWLPYDQVRDLNLTQPYFEALGVTNRADLPLGTGKPPIDDPQISLGAVAFKSLKSPPKPTHRSTYTTQIPLPPPRQNPYSMINPISYRPKSHYKKHPRLTVRADGLIQLGPDLVVHPLQLAEYVKFDKAIRRKDAAGSAYTPAGYSEFATTYNATNTSSPCAFTTWDSDASAYNLDSYSIPESLMEFPFSDPRYNDLRVFGLISKDGSLDTEKWDMMKNAILRPYRDAVRFQARAESRRQEKARKKRRMEEAEDHPEGFYIGYPKYGEPSSHRYKPRRSRQESIPREPTPPSHRDAEGEEDEEMVEEPPSA